MKLMFTLSILLVASVNVQADMTEKGKIMQTEGHSTPNCRTVVHKENVSGIQRTFRIKEAQVPDDISSIILTALVAQKDVAIFYDPAVTTGCGAEPKISYVRLYN